MSPSLLKISIIILGFVGMFLIRYLPFAIVGEKSTSKEFDSFIKYIPLGVFVAMIIKDVFYKGGELFISTSNIKLVPLLIVIAISVKFRNIGLSVVAGGVIMWIAMMI